MKALGYVLAGFAVAATASLFLTSRLRPEGADFAPTPTTLPEFVEQAIPTSDLILSPIPTAAVTIKPTQSLRPKTPITEEVLRKFFGMTDKAQIDQLLNNPAKVKEYEDNFYQKFKSFPIPQVTIISSTSLIAMPSKDGTMVCSGSQLGNLYAEIEKAEKEVYFFKMDMDCHYNKQKTETDECREWRRLNDQNKPTSTPNSLNDKLAILQKSLPQAETTYNTLITKYCIQN